VVRQILKLLDAATDEAATVILVDNEGEEASDESMLAPVEHRGAFLVGGLALMYTSTSRDPVCVMNTGNTFLIVVTSAVRLGAFLATHYKQPLPVSPAPQNVAERWLVSITSTGGLCRASIALGAKPGISQA
jgi:hypothetical protein